MARTQRSEIIRLRVNEYRKVNPEKADELTELEEMIKVEAQQTASKEFFERITKIRKEYEAKLDRELAAKTAEIEINVQRNAQGIIDAAVASRTQELTSKIFRLERRLQKHEPVSEPYRLYYA